MSVTRPALEQLQIRELACIGCGCSDSLPCARGCFWTYLDELTRVGLCSNCAALPLEELEQKMRLRLLA